MSKKASAVFLFSLIWASLSFVFMLQKQLCLIKDFYVRVFFVNYEYANMLTHSFFSSIVSVFFNSYYLNVVLLCWISFLPDCFNHFFLSFFFASLTMIWVAFVFVLLGLLWILLILKIFSCDIFSYFGHYLLKYYSLNASHFDTTLHLCIIYIHSWNCERHYVFISMYASRLVTEQVLMLQFWR